MAVTDTTAARGAEPAGTPEPERSTSRVARGVAIAVGVVAVLVVAVLGALFVFTNTDYGRERVRRFALAQLEKQAHGIVRMGALSGNLLRGLTIEDVSITDSAGAPFFAAERVRVGYSLRPFLSKKVFLRDVQLVRPVVVLDKPPNGEWNFARIFPGDTTTKTDSAPGWGSWLRFDHLRVVQGRVLVRTPWAPNDTLAAAQRDSVARLALAGGTRLEVVRVAGGYQKVSDFRQIDGRFPRVVLADPETPVKHIEVATARMIAAPFRPPVADVRDVKGTFELTGDSLWFTGVSAAFPASRLVDGAGRYDFDTGALLLDARGAPASFADFRWAYPPFPGEGSGTLDFAMAMTDTVSDFQIRRADVRVGRSALQGDLGFAIGRTVAFHDTDLRFQQFDTRLLEQLVPTLELPRNGLASGTLAMAGRFDSLTVDADVAFDDPSYGRSRLLAVGMLGYDSTAFRARDLRLTLAPVQVAMARIAMPTFPVRGVLGGTATLNGSTAARLVTVADLTHDDRGARSRVTGTAEVRFGPGVEGAPLAPPTPRVVRGGELTYTSRGARRRAGGGSARAPWVNADLRLHPLSLVTVGRFAPAVGLRGAATGPVRVTGSLADLAVRAPLTFSDGGGLDVHGRLDLASAEKGYDLRAAARLFNANAIVAKAPPTSLTMTASADGRGFDPATMRATITADVTTSTYDDVPVDSARLRARIGGGYARLDSSSVIGPAARARLHGTFGLAEGREGALVYTVQVDSLAAFNRFLPEPDTGTVAPRPRRAAIALARARADSAQIADRAAVERAATGRTAVTAEAKAKAKVSIDTAIAVRRDSLAGVVYAAGVLRGNVGRFDVRGRAATEGLVAYGNAARHGRIEYGLVGGGTPAMAVAAGAQLDSVLVAGFAIDTLDTRVTWRTGGQGTVALVVRQENQQEYSANAEYSLELDRNEVRWSDLVLRFDDTRWTATRPGAVRWGARGIEIDELDLRNGPAGRIYVDGLLPTEGRADLQVAIDNFQVGDLVALVQSDIEARGLLSLGMNFEGTTRDPSFRGAIGVREGSYRGSTLPELHGRFAYADARLEGRAEASRPGGRTFLTADGTLPVNLALAGVTGPRLAPDGPLSLDVVADSVPLDLVPRFTDVVANVSGTARGHVRVRGTVNDPDLDGVVVLEKAQAKVVALGITMRDVAGSVRLDGDTVVIDSLVGRSRGRALVRGGLGIKSLSAPSFNLFFVANDLRVIDNDQGRIDLDAGLQLSGPFDSAYVAGAINDISGVVYLPESQGKTVINAGDPAVFNVVDTSVVRNRELLPGQSPLLAGLRADVDVEVDRDTWVRNRDANVEIFSDGPLRVHVDRRVQAFTLTGVVSTERGEYEFLGKRFQIRRGSATFVGTPEINPILQITGEQPVTLAGQQTFNIEVVIGGTLQNPRITLQSDRQPPISQSDLLSYLAFSRSTSSLLQFEGSGTSLTSPSGSGGSIIGSTAQFATTRLAAIALGVAVDQLESGAAQSLGADVFHITPSAVNSDLFQGRALGFLQQTQVEYGRYFAGSRLYLALQGTPALVAPGALAQYRANAGWRYEASFQPRFILTDPTLAPPEKPVSTGAFGLSLVREWRF